MFRAYHSQSNKIEQTEPSDEATLLATHNESTTPQSIIIRIWIEPRDGDKKRTWYGHITTVGTDERVYVKSLREVALFFASFLSQSGARLPLIWQFRLWLRNLRKANP